MIIGPDQAESRAHLHQRLDRRLAQPTRAVRHEGLRPLRDGRGVADVDGSVVPVGEYIRG